MRKGIKFKLYRAFFITAVISLVISILLSQFDLIVLKNIAIENNQEIGTQAAQSSKADLTELAIESNQRFTLAQANNINQQLSEFAAQLNSVANYINYLYNHEEQFSLVKYNHPKDNGKQKNLQMQWILAPGMELTDDVLNEIYFQGNLEGTYKSIIQSNPNILGIYLTTKDGINTGYDGGSANKPLYFEGRDTDWYKDAVENNGLTISETYEDSFGRGLTVTMSRPCYGKNNEFLGVVALDILIEDLNREIRLLNLSQEGKVILLSENQTIIAALDMDKNGINDTQKYLGSSSEEIKQQMKNNLSGVSESVVGGQPVYVIYSPVELSNWTLAVILPVEEIIAPAEKSSMVIQNMAVQTEKELENQIRSAQILKLLLLAGVIVLTVFYTRKMSDNITKPILKLRENVRGIADGNLTYNSEIKTGDEIEELSDTFEVMTEELKQYIENLSKVTADKERIATELHVANQIQSSMLPCIFPAYPDRSEFDIYASMSAAKEVGGDFYDFFMIDHNHLGIVIADVSGKGVPAALFMVITKTLIKNHLQLKKQPEEVFQIVNNQLCENNEAGMFVTAFMGILDLQSGKFTYVNAGHNPPCIMKYGEEAVLLKSEPGFVLAGIENIVYRQKEITLHKNDKILFYTDGVTEAMNQKEELFGVKRLLHVLNQAKYESPQSLLDFIKKDIDSFVDGAEQTDDITIMAVEYKGGETSWPN